MLRGRIEDRLRRLRRRLTEQERDGETGFASLTEVRIEELEWVLALLEGRDEAEPPRKTLDSTLGAT